MFKNKNSYESRQNSNLLILFNDNKNHSEKNKCLKTFEILFVRAIKCDFHNETDKFELIKADPRTNCEFVYRPK